MIYTLTLNPAVDNVIQLPDKLVVGDLNRALSEKMFVGGKGINVSRVLNTLNRKSICLGFAGGFTGEFIEKELNKMGIKTDFVKIKENTRINTKVLGDIETEINGPSPKLNKEDINSLLKKLSTLTKDDLIVISGGIPNSISLKTYEEMLDVLNKNKVLMVVDTSGTPLLRSLKYNPFFIKPNKYELETLLGIKIKSETELFTAAKKLLNKGAQNVMVSLGKKGGIFVNNKLELKAKAINGRVINTVGAGDSAVAGFIDEYLKSNNYQKALNNAILVGCATAFSYDLTDKKMINQLRRNNK